MQHIEIESLVNILSMGAFNSQEFLKFGVAVFLYISDAIIPDATIWWGFTGTASHSTNYADTRIWGSYINASPDKSPSIPVCSRVVQIRVHNEFLYCRRLEILWRMYNPSTNGQIWLIVCANTWLRRSIQHRDFLVYKPNHPAAQ